jgi:DNA-binding LytR/AlgR family response regulator
MSDPTLQCMIVDDEPSARDILQQYIKDTPHATVCASCEDALEALEILQAGNTQVDVIFLDINMPRLTGLEMMKSQQELPPVILTTAYDEFALEAFDLDVVDYLLKPFPFDRFLTAVDKIRHKVEPDPLPPNGSNEPYVIVKADGKIYRIAFGDIKYVESTGDYVTYHTSTSRITSYDTLKHVESNLSGSSFLRIHKSYVVNLKHVRYLEGNQLKVSDDYLPIGPTYRAEVKSRFQA